VGYSRKLLAPADVPLLKALLRVFGEAFAEPQTYQGAVPRDAYLESFLRLPQTIALVAQEGEEVVGGLVAYELVKFEQERREIYIYDLAVGEGHRRRGVATGLIRELQRIGRARGAWVIYVQADPGDEPALRLYESLGTREDVYHFDIPVGDSGQAGGGGGAPDGDGRRDASDAE
jgi:aminoglycoside 3-N-acetyltransferase I